jgi:PilZ domain-containing protein
MDTPLQHERRSRQRFDFQIPISIRVNGSDHDEPAFTQDLSARGVFLYTDCFVEAGSAVELTFMMPSEITLAGSMRVRCRGKVLRVVHRDAVKNKVGMAIELLGYEYLTHKPDETQNRSDFDRISTLHEHPFGEQLPPAPLRRS